MTSFFYKYFLYYIYMGAVFLCMPFCFLVGLTGFYGVNKFCVDLLFRSKVMRKLVYSLSQFETANFTSSLYKRASNVCGMGVPTKLDFSVRIGETSSDDGIKSIFFCPASSYYDLFLWFKFRMKNFDHFNTVSRQKNPETSLEECVQLLSQYGFTTTNASSYYAGMSVYSKKFRHTFFLSLFVLAGSVTSSTLLFRIIYKFLKKSKWKAK